ncbi:hypothetical protein MASR2M48_08390 [Spirochaetota bacterium]
MGTRVNLYPDIHGMVQARGQGIDGVGIIDKQAQAYLSCQAIQTLHLSGVYWKTLVRSFQLT